MAKPTSVTEVIIWASVPVMLVGAVITSVVQDNRTGASVLFILAMVFLIIGISEHRRAPQRRRQG